MVTTVDRKSKDFGLEDWDEPILHPLYVGIACDQCGVPVLAAIGRETDATKPKGATRKRRIYTCLVCGAVTVTPRSNGGLRRLGDVDISTYQWRKRQREQRRLDKQVNRAV